MQRRTVIDSVPTEIWIYVMALLIDQTPCEHRVTPAFDDSCPMNLARGPVCPNVRSDRGHARGLVLTCKRFSDIGRIFLYREIRWSWRGYSSKLDRISRDRDLCKYVRALSLTVDDYPPSMRPYPPVLSFLENLRRLALHDAPFTPDLAEALLAARRLEYLEIDFCVDESPFTDDVPEDWSQGQFGPVLETLRVSFLPEEPTSMSKYVQLFSPSINRLETDIHPSTDIQRILDEVQRGAISLTGIRTLILRERDPAKEEPSERYLVTTLISRCTQLETLWINDWLDFTSIPLPEDGPSKLRFIGGAHLGGDAVEHALSLPDMEAFHFSGNLDPVDRSIREGIKASGLKQLVTEGMKWTADDMDYIVSIAPNVERLEVEGMVELSEGKDPKVKWIHVSLRANAFDELKRQWTANHLIGLVLSTSRWTD